MILSPDSNFTTGWGCKENRGYVIANSILWGKCKKRSVHLSNHEDYEDVQECGRTAPRNPNISTVDGIHKLVSRSHRIFSGAEPPGIQ
jgi:hypothetical protein